MRTKFIQLSKIINPFLFFFVFNQLFARHVDLITIDGAITPVVTKYIKDGIERSEKENAECLIIEMDTPGGLMSATMDIDKALLASEVPVVVYVTPSGGRAASAGVFITYASHIASMSPSTNIGSAHPVSMMGNNAPDSTAAMMEKVVNDAVAHITGLAEERGRNVEWAEKAIRESVSITEKVALKKNVINFIADNLADLLDQINGTEVEVNSTKKMLNTDDAEVKHHPMGFQYKILNKIADPNILVGLLFIAGLGLYFELSNPGAILPGVLAAICITLFLFGTQVLAISTAGLLFIILGIIFFIIEVYTPTFGVLTAGGIVSLLIGSLMLFKSPDVQVSWSFLIPSLIFMLLFVVLGLYLVVKTRLTRPTTGKRGLVGERGVALDNIKTEGQVSVHGEVWKAESDDPIKKGEKIEVEGVEGLVLKVKKIEKKQS